MCCACYQECMHRVISEMRMLSRSSWRSASLFPLIVVFALLVPTSIAGRPCNFLTDHDALRHQGEAAVPEQKEAVVVPLVHGRMLNVKTNDYGSYDPSPTMDKPHFKLIPN